MMLREIPDEYKRFYSMDPCEILGVPRNASVVDLEAARNELLKKYHPDISTDALATEISQRINQAFDALTEKNDKVGDKHRKTSSDIILSDFREDDPIKRNLESYHVAAQLSRRIGDYDNAAEIYKDIERGDLAASVRPLPSRAGETQKDVARAERSDENILLAEKLMRKIVRWLTTKEEWEKNEKQPSPTSRDFLANVHLFQIDQEPEYIKLKEVNRNVENFIAQKLGLDNVRRVSVIERMFKGFRMPGQREIKGIELGNFENRVLILSEGSVYFVPRENLERVT